MIALTRLPIRVRLTIAFAAGVAVLLAVTGVFVYVRMGAALLAATDSGLRSRAEILAADVRARGPALADVRATLIERDEAFAQIADASGAIVQSSEIVTGSPLLPPATITSLRGATFFNRHIPGIDDVTRVLAVPVQPGGQRSVVMVGSSLQDRRDELLQLAATLAIGGPVALVLISGAGWLLAGGALSPIERMRRETAAISTSTPARRLHVPDTDDEVARLGATLNAMLDRIQESVERERQLVDNAAHELRSPLTIMKGEVGLTLSRPRSPEELAAALESVSEETDHLVRLADDLLILARMNGGEPPVFPVDTRVSDLLERAVLDHRATAKLGGVGLAIETEELSASVDPIRLQQALDNLIDNALRHSPSGGVVRIAAERRDGGIRISVEDSGPGFPNELLDSAFEPFTRARTAGEDGGAGLGLAIVRMIAEAHGGSAVAENRTDGGARVTLTIPDASRS